jgi:hypothetical protein
MAVRHWFTREQPLTVVLLAVGLVSIAPAQNPQTAQFSGKVTSERAVPISGVEVAILELHRLATTDSIGRFDFLDIPPGSYTLRCRRIGYVAEFLQLTVAPTEHKQAVIVLAAGTYRLPDVEVTAVQLKPVEYAYTHKYDDFFWRRRVGFGSFITRAQIDRLQPLDTPRLVSLAPGVSLRFANAQNVDVRVRSCRSIGVWVDGAKQKWPELYRRPSGAQDSAAIAAGFFLGQIPAIRVEMVAVFRGPAEMPAEFLPDECAIAIWTR